MGEVISGMEEVAPAARSTGKSQATQNESLKLFLQDDRCARSNHVRQLIHIPVRQADTPRRFAVADVPWIRRPMNSIVRFREADPHCADRAVRPGRQYCARLFRVWVPEEF